MIKQRRHYDYDDGVCLELHIITIDSKERGEGRSLCFKFRA